MKNVRNIILITIFIIFILLIMSSNVYGAGIGMSISKSSAYVGDSFSVTISGINGKVSISGSSNITLSASGTKWVDGSMKITGKAKSAGTATITVTPIDVTTNGANPQFVTSAASRSIKISTKPTPKPKPKATPTPKPTIMPTPKPTTTPKPKDDFYITKLVLKGVKENGERTDIELSPKFSKKKYKYTCNIGNDIQKIELEKDAGKYTKYITVKGLDELKEEENTITVTLSAKNQKTKTYIIKLIKEAETVATSSEPEEQNTEENLNNVENNMTEVEKKDKEPIMVSMPLGAFIAMQAGIIVVEVIVIGLINKNLHRGRRRH